MNKLMNRNEEVPSNVILLTSSEENDTVNTDTMNLDDFISFYFILFIYSLYF
jgi:hypothetical protein